MNLAIVGGQPSLPLYKLVDKKLNELIETSGCYLFNVLCSNTGKEKSLGEWWANENGAPIVFITAKTADELVRKLFLKANYIIFILDGNPFINKIFMQYKMMGKHGSIIKI